MSPADIRAGSESAPPPDRIIRLEYRLRDGLHTWTSPDVPGLCAAHRELDLATRAVGVQLAVLLSGGSWGP